MPLYIVAAFSAMCFYGIYRNTTGLNRPVVEQHYHINIYIQPDNAMTTAEVLRVVEGAAMVVDSANVIPIPILGEVMSDSGGVPSEWSQEVID